MLRRLNQRHQLSHLPHCQMASTSLKWTNRTGDAHKTSDDLSSRQAANSKLWSHTL